MPALSGAELMPKHRSKTISIVIMAGGTGGSFSPISHYMPKSLAFIGTKPLIHHILNSFSGLPIDRVYIILGKFGDMIENYIREARSINYPIEFFHSDEHDKIGGCLLRIRSRIRSTFLVYYGDILLEDFNFPGMLAFHRHMKTDRQVLGTLAFSRSYPLNVGLLKLDRSRRILRGFSEKPTGHYFNVNMAISIFEPGIFDYIKDRSEDLYGTVIPRAMKKARKFAGFEHKNRWWHLHTVADLHNLLIDNKIKSKGIDINE
jgi:NDP-sugar pyrophosphorylase family protein